MTRGIRLLLILSLVLNIFVVGALVGGAIIWLRGSGPAAVRAERGGNLRTAGEQLGEAERTAFRAAMREGRREARPLAVRVRAGRAEAARLMAAPTFDKVAFEAALGDVRDAEFGMRIVLERRAATFAASLPAASRRQLAEALARRPAARPRRD